MHPTRAMAIITEQKYFIIIFITVWFAGQSFETLDDLNNADDVMTQLLNIDWYRGLIQGKQMVMIGYSDSAK
ncbi:phosphoenolpyruvate carboxylase, partial [Salmonella enterica subsp. enterica serovar Anatum]|nr:phosphoenolpyruvate carboxylase [Salmonella enterica subsp. enterica serovar Anatum]